MQHQLNRAYPAPREAQPFVWGLLIVVAMVVAAVFAPTFSRSDRQPPASEPTRICWPLEAGVDAQCMDRSP